MSVDSRRRHGEEESCATAHYGCPHCERAGYHPVVARPASQVSHANSLPAVVLLCIHCGKEFERLRALDPEVAMNPTVDVTDDREVIHGQHGADE